MNKKLSILKAFLNSLNLKEEARACSDLIKLATPIMLGDEYYETTRSVRKNLGIHGWVYILKTSPTDNGDAPFGWYVGSSTTPEKRFLEHTVTKAPWKDLNPPGADEKDKYIIKTDSTPRGFRPKEHKIYDFKSPSFTGAKQVFEVVCMQMMPITTSTENMKDKEALRKLEEDTFITLAQFVGGSNIGGDHYLMKTIKIGDERIETESIPVSKELAELNIGDGPQEKQYYSNEVKRFIAETFGCDSGPDKYSDFTENLNTLDWSSLTDRDFARMEKSNRLYEGKWRRAQEEAKRWLEENVGNLSEDEAEALKNDVENLIKNDLTILDEGRLLSSIDKNIPLLKGIDTEQKLSALASKYFGGNWLKSFKLYLEYEKERENITKALKSSQSIGDATEKLNISRSALATRLEKLDINSLDYLGKDSDYIVFRESGEKIYKQDIEKALRCAKSVNDAARFFGKDKSNNRTFSRYIYNLLYPGLPLKEQKRMIEEEYISKESRPEDREWAKQRGFTCFNPNPSRDELLEALIKSKGNNQEAANTLNTTQTIVKARRNQEGLGAVALRKILLERMNEESYKDPDIGPDVLD